MEYAKFITPDTPPEQIPPQTRWWVCPKRGKIRVMDLSDEELNSIYGKIVLHASRDVLRNSNNSEDLKRLAPLMDNEWNEITRGFFQSMANERQRRGL